MFSSLDVSSLASRYGLRKSMLCARTQQFVARHRWNLQLNAEGLEVDQFDVKGTTYCISHEEEQHVASLRIRPAADGNMVEEAFNPLWVRHQGRLSASHEVTRFCCTPDLSVQGQASGVSELLLGLYQLCKSRGIEEFFGVVFPSVARTLRILGWPPTIIDEMGSGSNCLLLCVWQPSHSAASTLLEKAGRHHGSQKPRALWGTPYDVTLLK